MHKGCYACTLKYEARGYISWSKTNVINELKSQVCLGYN